MVLGRDDKDLREQMRVRRERGGRRSERRGGCWSRGKVEEKRERERDEGSEGSFELQ